ncbi:DUF421 domain-containing protein [Ruminococcus sp. Marseille-P6503]|uniref:DUF421 domain-containing protein n=1 Tax=Ruminococcus sp. Marseille-P6503 TaxID=2364796 RepID=UPI000F520629|nr:DUF421 domain-containing protein [Ruminococcus sp. Marseille-P6503]
MLIVFFRAIILYFIIVISIRLMGKRQIGELQPSELVITILMSNIATLPIEDINIPMIMGVVPIFTLVCLDVFMSQLSLYSRKVRKFFSGTPKIIISDGAVDQEVMKKLRFTIDDLMESLRSVEVFDLEDVQLAIVETTGKISVYQKQSSQPCTRKDMGIEAKCKNPPQLIVTDGEIADRALDFIGADREWLMKALEREKCPLEKVFLMTCDSDRKYKLIRKEK